MNPQPTLLDMPKFIPPTIEQVRNEAQKMSLNDQEAIKFWLFYESKDWFVGKNKMKKWLCSLALWKRTSDERGGGSGGRQAAPAPDGSGPLTPAQMTMYNQEYQRILARIKVIDNSYDSHQDMRIDDRIEKGKLFARKNELKKLLGLTI